MRVATKALKIHIYMHLGVNISIKLNEMLIDSSVVFFRLPGPFEASIYEISFGRWLYVRGGEQVK